jgi:hypothetical protein
MAVADDNTGAGTGAEVSFFRRMPGDELEDVFNFKMLGGLKVGKM